MVHSELYMSIAVAVAVAVQSAEAPKRCLACVLLHRLICNAWCAQPRKQRSHRLCRPPGVGLVSS